MKAKRCLEVNFYLVPFQRFYGSKQQDIDKRLYMTNIYSVIYLEHGRY